MDAGTPEEAGELYWRVEGNAFFQRELYQAAEPVTDLVVHELIAGHWRPCGLVAALDLLVEISKGFPALSEQMLGDNDLDQRCREIIRSCLPYLYELASSLDEKKALRSIIDLTDELEEDLENRKHLLDLVLPFADDPVLRRSVGDLRGHGSRWCGLT